MNEGIVIVCGSTLFFGTMLLIILGFFAFIRYVRYQETMKLAEKGLVKPVSTSSGNGTLVWGIVITALGLALCLGLYPIGWVAAPGEFPLNFGPWMLIGLAPTFFGLALVLVYALTAERKKKEIQAFEPSIDIIE